MGKWGKGGKSRETALQLLQKRVENKKVIVQSLPTFPMSSLFLFFLFL